MEKTSENQLKHRPVGDMKLLLEDIMNRGLKLVHALDVGANLSHWSRLMKSVSPDVKIYMIEPLPEMESALKNFCKDFPDSKYFLAGAGSKIENHFITTYHDDPAGATCLVGENEYLKSVNKQRSIPIITIDSLIEKGEIEIPEIVKLDIQGFELEALKGAKHLFGKTEVFILETSLFEYTKGTPLFSEVVIFMAERDYEIYDFPGFLRRPYDGALGQLDVCFTKKFGILRDSNVWFKK
ncbi:MAG: FkbM family methyltransferase [bacterium]|nr:FkbM family methyltransferase [bacterium]